MVENLSERGFIWKVVKAEMLHCVQHDAPGRERSLVQRLFASLRVTKKIPELHTGHSSFLNWFFYLP